MNLQPIRCPDCSFVPSGESPVYQARNLAQHRTKMHGHISLNQQKRDRRAARIDTKRQKGAP